MKKKLLINGLVKLLSTVLFLGILLYIPAGTLNYQGATRMILILIIPMIITGVGLSIINPKLLEKRLNNKEEQSDQKQVIIFSLIMFVSSFIICGLDYRFKITNVSKVIVVMACVVFLLTYIGFIELLRENEYLSRTVEVQDGQKVVDTGMYGIVRHPMYSIITFMFLSMPLIVGSYLGLLPLLAFPYIIVKRINNEEKVLEEGLKGYREYKQKVKYRMIPFIY